MKKVIACIVILAVAYWYFQRTAADSRDDPVYVVMYPLFRHIYFYDYDPDISRQISKLTYVERHCKFSFRVQISFTEGNCIFEIFGSRDDEIQNVSSDIVINASDLNRLDKELITALWGNQYWGAGMGAQGEASVNWEIEFVANGRIKKVDFNHCHSDFSVRENRKLRKCAKVLFEILDNYCIDIRKVGWQSYLSDEHANNFYEGLRSKYNNLHLITSINEARAPR